MSKFKSKKYKSLLRLREVYRETPRILNFKRPKWTVLKKIYNTKFLQTSFSKKLKKKYSKLLYFKQSGYLIPTKWSNLRFQHREAVLSKVRLYHFFLLKTRLTVLKNQLENAKSIETFLLTLESRLDVLLWRAGCFESPAIARFYINHKNIFVNGKSVNLTSFLLKNGDFISFSDFIKEKIIFYYSKSNIIKTARKNLILQKKSPQYVMPFYLEINWDTLNIAVINFPQKEQINKLAYLYNTNINLPALRNYLWKI